MARSSEPARLAIIEAAEVLFAERGVEAPTLREIGAAAGQRNNSAVQYHFGDRAGLVVAVLDPHLDALDRHRRVLLDEAEARGSVGLSELIDILLLPLAAKVEDPSGVRYLRIQAGLLGAGGARLGSAVTRAWRRPAMVEVVERIVAAIGPLGRAEGEARQLLVLTLVFNGLANVAELPAGPDPAVVVPILGQALRALLAVSASSVATATDLS